MVRCTRIVCLTIYAHAVIFEDMVLFFDLAEAISIHFKLTVASSLLKSSCSRNGVEKGHLLTCPANCHGSCSSQPKFQPTFIHFILMCQHMFGKKMGMNRTAKLGHGNNKQVTLPPHMMHYPYPFDTRISNGVVGSSLQRLRVS